MYLQTQISTPNTNRHREIKEKPMTFITWKSTNLCVAEANLYLKHQPSSQLLKNVLLIVFRVPRTVQLELFKEFLFTPSFFQKFFFSPLSFHPSFSNSSLQLRYGGLRYSPTRDIKTRASCIHKIHSYSSSRTSPSSLLCAGKKKKIIYATTLLIAT